MTRTRTCPYDAVVIHSTWTVTSTSVTSSFLQNKEIILLHHPLFLTVFLVAAVYDLHRLDKQGCGKNYAIFTSHAGNVPDSLLEQITAFVQGHFYWIPTQPLVEIVLLQALDL